MRAALEHEPGAWARLWCGAQACAERGPASRWQRLATRACVCAQDRRRRGPGADRGCCSREVTSASFSSALLRPVRFPTKNDSVDSRIAYVANGAAGTPTLPGKGRVLCAPHSRKRAPAQAQAAAAVCAGIVIVLRSLALWPACDDPSSSTLCNVCNVSPRTVALRAKCVGGAATLVCEKRQ